MLSFWDLVIERIQGKLECWKKSYISMGGRITLIKATLSNLPVYYMSLFKMPLKIISQVKKYQRDFLWKGGFDKKDHLVNWKEVCRPKLMGGLGIGKIKERNMVLMGMWLWRFSMEQDSLWYSTISHRYGHHPNGWDCNSPFMEKHLSFLPYLFIIY